MLKCPEDFLSAQRSEVLVFRKGQWEEMARIHRHRDEAGPDILNFMTELETQKSASAWATQLEGEVENINS